MKDYSQSGEQAIILKYFGDFRGMFLDIGANDGVTLSNTRALVLLGWHGVLIEPSAKAFDKLVGAYGMTRPNPIMGTEVGDIKVNGCLVNGPILTFVRAALVDKDGPIDLYDSGTHLKQGDVALLSTTIPKQMDRWKRSGEQFTKTAVRGITFETLIKECGQDHFDLISIDAEGADWEILKQIDLTAVGCCLLCVEVNNGADSHFTQYAAKHGMRLIHSNYENRIYGR